MRLTEFLITESQFDDRLMNNLIDHYIDKVEFNGTVFSMNLPTSAPSTTNIEVISSEVFSAALKDYVNRTNRFNQSPGLYKETRQRYINLVPSITNKLQSKFN